MVKLFSSPAFVRRPVIWRDKFLEVLYRVYTNRSGIRNLCMFGWCKEFEYDLRDRQTSAYKVGSFVYKSKSSEFQTIPADVFLSCFTSDASSIESGAYYGFDSSDFLLYNPAAATLAAKWSLSWHFNCPFIGSATAEYGFIFRRTTDSSDYFINIKW